MTVIRFPKGTDDFAIRWEILKDNWIDFQSRLMLAIGSQSMTEDMLEGFEVELIYLEAEMERLVADRQGQRVQ